MADGNASPDGASFRPRAISDRSQRTQTPGTTSREASCLLTGRPYANNLARGGYDASIPPGSCLSTKVVFHCGTDLAEPRIVRCEVSPKRECVEINKPANRVRGIIVQQIPDPQCQAPAVL